MDSVAKGCRVNPRCLTMVNYGTSEPQTKHFEEPLYHLKWRGMIQFWQQLSLTDVKLKQKVPNMNALEQAT